MAPLVVLENVSKSYAVRTLLDGVTIGVNPGERIGIVGRNGDGKTTLISLLTGAVEPDSGRVTPVGGLHIGVLAQADSFAPDSTVRDVVVGDRPDYEWASDARVRDVMTGLLGGLDADIYANGLDTAVAGLSGGERRRAALAALLIGEQDLLVLDEPTNHLDVEGIAWLAAHLRARRSSLVVVTHDRWFLDEVCTTTWEVEGGEVHVYDGGYAAYVLARAERMRVSAASEHRRRQLVRKELAWLRRGPPARTSKPQFRIDAANALIADVPTVRDEVELVKFATARLGKTVYEIEDADVAVGVGTPSEKTLFRDITWRIGPGDRIGVVGVNGAGKTTLFKLVLGELSPVTGRVVRGKTVKPALLTQVPDDVDPTLRVLEAVSEVRQTVTLAKGKEMSAGQLLERFGFVGERQWTPVADLSGGELRRLTLMRLLMTEPNVLLLDEPTNDLDIETLTALEDLLDGWPGTLLVISHDRYFLERVCDRFVAVLGDPDGADGGLRDLPGGVDAYLALRAAQPATRKPSRDTASSGHGATDTGSSTITDGAAAPTPAQVREARKELQKIERRIARLDDDEKKLHGEMATHATDHAKVTALSAQLHAVRDEKEQLEAAWLEAAELTE
jgi:ABC transport system ATP-binding/permease protein